MPVNFPDKEPNNRDIILIVVLFAIVFILVMGELAFMVHLLNEGFKP